MLRHLLPLIYPQRSWIIPRETPTVYLTFDDGPHPEITPWVMDQLESYGARGSFFVVGQRAQAQPSVLAAIEQRGHLLGNHTWDHLKGWSCSTAVYLQSFHQAARYIPGHWFRPPYGKMTFAQARHIRKAGYSIAMWDVLTGDYRTGWDADDCWRHSVPRLRNGSLLVLHDSEKAWPRLKILLPRLLKHLQGSYRMESLPDQ